MPALLFFVLHVYKTFYIVHNVQKNMCKNSKNAEKENNKNFMLIFLRKRSINNS